MKRGGKIFVIGFFLIVLMEFAVAADVAYVYRNLGNVDQNVVDVLSEMGNNVDLIKEGSSLSAYDIIYVGDEKFRKSGMIPVGDLPTIVTNYYHGDIWGISDRDGISKLASNSPLNVNKNGQMVQVYTRATDRHGIGIPYYYIDDLNTIDSPSKVAGVYTGDLNYDFGDVIAYFGTGSNLFNEEMAGNNICFFGLVASDFWTSAARNMFKDCVNFVMRGVGNGDSGGNDGKGNETDMNETEPGNQTMPGNETDMNETQPGNQTAPGNQTGNETDMNETDSGNQTDSEMLVHDVGFVGILNAIGVIRIEHQNGTLILGGDNLLCNEKYKIIFNIKNKGNFTENVTFEGLIGSLGFNHLPIDNFVPGDSKLKTRTVNMTLVDGQYSMKIDALLDNYVDASQLDNIAMRNVTVACPVDVSGNLTRGTV